MPAEHKTSPSDGQQAVSKRPWRTPRLQVVKIDRTANGAGTVPDGMPGLDLPQLS
jgi:hypothetical protein